MTYLYQIKVANRNTVQVNKLDQKRSSLGQPAGVLHYEEKREVLEPLLEAQRNHENNGEKIKALGEILFSILFEQALQIDFVTFYNQARQEKKILRIELDIDEKNLPDIAALPWEFMRLPQGANLGTIWVGTAPDISLTRKRSQWLPAQPIQLVAEEKLRIGLVVSTPEGLGKVDSQTLEKSLQELAVNNPNLVEILPTTAGNPEAINELLERRKPHILHFIAHGRVKDEDNQDVEQLALSDPNLNDPVWVNADYISGILEEYKPALVFLQACDSGALSANQPFFGIASRIVQQNVAVVIAMQYAVTNATANRFSRKFYEKILTGEPVDIAAQDARKFITLGATLYNKRDFATPVIFMRVEEGNLFVAQGNAERVFSPLSMEQPESFKKVLPRRLEGAMPRQATINIITEVRTMISLLDSPSLKQFLPDYTATGDLITKKDAQSNIFPVEFPVNSNNELQAINLYLTLVAQDFDIHNPRIDFMLDPQIDSGIMTFFLIPKKIQPRARIIITVFKNPERTTQLGSLTLVTEVLDEGVAIDKSWRLGATIAELELHESNEAIKGMISTEQNCSNFNIDSRFPPETSRHPQSKVIDKTLEEEDTNVKQYREEVKKYLSDRWLEDYERTILDVLRDKLGLSSEKANQILEEELIPIYQGRQAYESLLKAVIKYYPFSDGVKSELKKFQAQWNLTDREVNEISQPILEQAEIAYQEKLQQQAHTPPILLSARGIDYRELEGLLKQQRWKEADELTYKVMLEVANRSSEGWLRVEDIDNFPCEDLRTIDGLWVDNSKGRFGFSVQAKIYRELGGTREYNEKVWKAFGDRMGWRVRGSWIYYKDVTFDLKAPQGHLPSGKCWGLLWDCVVSSSLASRLVKCNI